MTEKERWEEGQRKERGREVEAKGTRIHCVALCCPEGGVLTLCVSFLSFFFSLLYKHQSPETLGLGRVVESASWPPGVPHSGRVFSKVTRIQLTS